MHTETEPQQLSWIKTKRMKKREMKPQTLYSEFWNSMQWRRARHMQNMKCVSYSMWLCVCSRIVVVSRWILSAAVVRRHSAARQSVCSDIRTGHQFHISRHGELVFAHNHPVINAWTIFYTEIYFVWENSIPLRLDWSKRDEYSNNKIETSHSPSLKSFCAKLVWMIVHKI